MNDNPTILEPYSPTIMTCDEIKHGMMFDPDGLKTWIVLSVDERGPRHNRFFCSPLDNAERIVLFCFDAIFEKTKYNFRFPSETP